MPITDAPTANSTNRRYCAGALGTEQLSHAPGRFQSGTGKYHHRHLLGQDRAIRDETTERSRADGAGRFGIETPRGKHASRRSNLII